MNYELTTHINGEVKTLTLSDRKEAVKLFKKIAHDNGFKPHQIQTTFAPGLLMVCGGIIKYKKIIKLKEHE